VKSALIALAAAGLAYGMSFGGSASARAHVIGSHSLTQPAVHLSALEAAHFSTQRSTFQTGGTGTPTTATPVTPTVQPSPTATSGPSYPDPIALLNTSITKFEAISSVKFTQSQVAEQTNVEKITVNATGVASCKGDYVHVKGSDQILGTAQNKKVDYWFEQTVKDFFKKQVVTDATKHKWQKVKAKSTYPFGFSGWSVENPLFCFQPASTGGGSGGGSGDSGGGTALRNLVNLGPASYAGANTWHIQATDDGQDDQGNPQHLVLDYYVTQDFSVLVGFKATFTDPNHDITETAEQKFLNPGKKVTIPKIKVGSTKP
jgi:hypothetical protein